MHGTSSNISYSSFDQTLTPEDGVRAEHYSFSSQLEFYAVLKYLFNFEVAFFKSAKLDSKKISVFK